MLLFSAGVAIFTVRWAVRAWRDPQYFRLKVSFFGPFNEDMLHGLSRGLAPFAASMTALALALPFLLISMVAPRNHGFAVIGLSLVLVFVAGVALQVAVAGFNRPKWCVPPYLRAEPGVWAARRQARHKRHQAGRER